MVAAPQTADGRPSAPPLSSRLSQICRSPKTPRSAEFSPQQVEYTQALPLPNSVFKPEANRLDRHTTPISDRLLRSRCSGINPALRPQSLRVSEFGAPALDVPCPLHWIFKEPAKAGAPNADKPFPALTSDALASVSVSFLLHYSISDAVASVSVSQPSHLQSLLCPGINLSVLRQ